MARTAISDARILRVHDQNVTFRWKDRADANRLRELSLPGVDFVARYLRHVLPRGLRSVRYYGFCHPSAKANRLRIQFNPGRAVDFGAVSTREAHRSAEASVPRCPRCGEQLRVLSELPTAWDTRGPPKTPGPGVTRGRNAPIAS